MTATDVSTNVGPGAETDHDDTGHTSDLVYFKVFVVLVFLTAAEVSTYAVELGNAMLPALIVMMVVKFALVVMFFMHLRYDARPLTTLFLGPLLIATMLAIALMTLTGAFLIFGR